MEYPDKYLTNLLEHMSEYDENKISKLIKEEYFIEAMILIHRHIAEQIRHLLVENIEKINKKLVSGNFINIIKKLEDEKVYELAYNLNIINLKQKSILNSLNNFRLFTQSQEKGKIYI